MTVLGVRDGGCFGTREFLRWLLTMAVAAWRGVRQTLRRVDLLRSGWGLAQALADLLRDSPEHSRAEFEATFRTQRDPWGFSRSCEQERFNRAAGLLDAVRSGGRFRRTLEVGCAEGVFTEWLSARCESLMAVDFSPIALARARGRCAWDERVHFGEWDLRRDAPPGVFDLVVVMDVLECFARPAHLREARAKLVEAVARGGYLLVGNSRQSKLFETTWWGKRLIRGGKWINAFVAEHPELLALGTITAESDVHTLCRRV